MLMKHKKRLNTNKLTNINKILDIIKTKKIFLKEHMIPSLQLINSFVTNLKYLIIIINDYLQLKTFPSFKTVKVFNFNTFFMYTNCMTSTYIISNRCPGSLLSTN